MSTNGWNYEVKTIVDFLKQCQVELDKIYIWDTPNDKQVTYLLEEQLITQIQAYELLNEPNMFLRNIRLKNIMCLQLNAQLNDRQTEKLYNWIVKEWGGLKNTSNIKDKVVRALGDIELKKQCDFDNISSVSKVLSFIDPSKYIIYDTRVAYTLNWILLKTGSGTKYFPMPQGRNSKLNAFDIGTLIRLNHIKVYEENKYEKKVIYKCDSQIFINKKEAYLSLCNLISEINKYLWEDDTFRDPYYTEMLLFAIADKYIFEDILSTYSNK